MNLDIFENFTSHGEIESEWAPLAPFSVSSVPKRAREGAEDDEGQTLKVIKQSDSQEPVADDLTIEKPPARTYKFKLDPFQQEAVNYIERGESVLVAAHTSAGKTAVAEYAIAKSLRDKQRVIYTSPIKALSNQKFRDMQEEFGDVGLMTGDMTINPHASCLIMTTEILRSMLYRGSEVVREVAWVVYDEVHYMRDKERGVVWEESIILLPHKVRFVFLSATIPNAPAFVDWVSKIHHQPCHVVYTDYRPVPLQHYLFPAAAEGLYLVVDEKSKFREEMFQKAMAALQPPTIEDQGGDGKKSTKKPVKNINADLMKIVNLIMTRQLDPCIVFSFSKRDCETYASLMCRLEFNTEEEKVLIDKVFHSAIEGLSEEDQALPQVHSLLPLLKRGIGVHHGGLLPILKEVVEILFQEGLIKCLFATETFAIGINMPAKTVVFTSTRKFDGQDFRWVTSGEYIQMSGRAGRRGKDDKGVVIQMIDEKMSPDVAKNMIYGASDPLYSAYHIGYDMVLNMLRVEGADPLLVIKNSFLQFQQEKEAPLLLQQAMELDREVQILTANNQGILTAESEKQFLELWTLKKTMSIVETEIGSILRQPAHCLPFLQSGRLLKLSYQGVNFGWVVCLQAKKNDKGITVRRESTLGKMGPKGSFVGDILLEVLCEVIPKSSSEIEFDKEQDEAEKLLVQKEAHKRKTDIFAGASLPADALSVEQEKDDQRCREAFLRGLSFKPSAGTIDGKSELRLLSVSLDALVSLSAVRLTIPATLTPASAGSKGKDDERAKVRRALREVQRRFESEGLPELTLHGDMGIVDDRIDSLVEQRTRLRERVDTLQQHFNSQPESMVLLEAKRALQSQADGLRAKANSLQTICMRGQLRHTLRVLKRLEFVSVENVLSLKGRFACEISASHTLLTTSLIFAGALNSLSVTQTVALCAALVNPEKGASSAAQPGNSQATIDLRGVRHTEMHKPLRALHSLAQELASVLAQEHLQADEQSLAQSVDTALVDVAFDWAAGSSFAAVVKNSDLFEGSIVRSLRRLEELLRQLSAAAASIGNDELVARFADGAQKIRRGVVFAASLYI